MSALTDAPDRPLTVAEQRDRELLLPALQAWTSYLQARGWHGTYPDATAAGGAVELRDRSAETSDLIAGVRVAVQPYYALAYHHHFLAVPNRAHLVTYSLLVQALRYMGSEPVGKFSPAGEHTPTFPRVRTVRGWWHLTREQQRRLQFGHYVPVLTRKHGPRPRPVPMDPPATAARAGRLRLATDPMRMIELLREYTDPARATALLGTAVREQRPLCTRRAGRAPRDGSATINVVTTSAVVGLIGLVSYAETARDRYGLRVVTLDAIRGELEALEREQPDQFVPCRAFAAYDSGGTLRNQPGWWRVPFAMLGHDDADMSMLAGEVAVWRLAPTPAAPEPEPVTDAAAPTDGDRWGRGEHDVYPTANGQYVMEEDRADMTRAERAEHGLLYPDE